MAEKRGHEDDRDGSNKRPRSETGSPAPVANGAKTMSIQEQIAAIKARASAVRDRANAGRPASSVPAAPANPAEAARAKIEAMKARVAAATAKSGAAPPARTASPLTPQPPADADDGGARARGGLGIGLHPALMGDPAQDRARTKGPMPSRFSTTMGNRRAVSPVERAGSAKPKKQLDLSGPSLEELKKDPYYDPSVAGPGQRGRKSRDLLFHQKGKFIAQAAALRRQAQLEEMKKRIAESAKKAGLDEDKSEQAFLVPEPPKVEWWDEGLLTGNTYPDFDDDAMTAEEQIKIDGEDSVITRYVQHPVLLEPPQEKHMPAQKPLFMTREEQKKKRRQDRLEDRKEKQAKVRLGLEPPEPPKVKKSNLMRVLGEQAVKDPTAVEARVNREIAERAQKHEETNADRALTKEQRKEKLESNQEKDAAKGIMCSVYRIDSLAYGKHRYQVDVHAKQHALTGIVIMHPRCNLVIVEGGQKGISTYKKLMLKRIKWTDISAPTTAAEVNVKEHHQDIADKSWLQPMDESTGELRDQSENRCQLIWEGEERDRAFRKWGSRVCETDAEARRALEKNRMENMWQLARNWTG